MYFEHALALIHKSSMKTYIFFFIIIFGLSKTIAQQIEGADSINLAKLIEFSKNTYTDEILLIQRDEVICHWINEKCDSQISLSFRVINLQTYMLLADYTDCLLLHLTHLMFFRINAWLAIIQYHALMTHT